MNFSVILLFVVAAVATHVCVAADVDNCECGAFPKPHTTSQADPKAIITLGKTTECNDQAAHKCKKECTKATQSLLDDDFPGICDNALHLEPITVTVFSRACKSLPWECTCVTFNKVTCCHLGKVVDCDTLPPPPTDVNDVLYM